MKHLFEARDVSAWIDPTRIERAERVLSDPRLHPTRIGSSDARTRRQLAERFGAEAFDDLRMLAVATDTVLWVDRDAPLGERECDVLSSEDIALVSGSCTLPFLLAVPQCEMAPSFRRMSVGGALLGVCDAFGRVDVLQASVAVPSSHHLSEGLRVAAAAAIAVLGPIDQVTAFEVLEGAMTASVVGQRGLGTLAVGVGTEAVSLTLIGDGGLAAVTSGLVAWRRQDGAWVEETRLSSDGDEPIIRTILEAERPATVSNGLASIDDSNRRARLRIAALVDTLRLSARTAQAESVEAMLRGFGVDPLSLQHRSG
jgi:hypothetical protein